jgi:hypothetical protein
MIRKFAPAILLGLLCLTPLCAQDNAFIFNGSVRVIIAPLYPDINFYGATQMHDLQFPVANPRYKAWWQLTMVPEDPTVTAQLTKLSAQVVTGHVSATGTPSGHMILQFGSSLGDWKVDITPMDVSLRQQIAAEASNPALNGDAGVQILTFVVGSDSITVTAMQMANTEGQQFFWQRRPQ